MCALPLRLKVFADCYFFEQSSDVSECEILAGKLGPRLAGKRAEVSQWREMGLRSVVF